MNDFYFMTSQGSVYRFDREKCKTRREKRCGGSEHAEGVS